MSEGDRRDGPDDRRDYGDGPTPGAQRQLDHHLWLIRVGLSACGFLFFLLIVFMVIGFVKIGDIAKDATSAANAATAASDDATAALERVEAFAVDLRNSAVRGCQRQNRVRKRQHDTQDTVRKILHRDIIEARHPDPAVLKLLGLTMEDVEGINDKRIHRLQRLRQLLNNPLPLSPCEAVYPSPNETDPARINPAPR